MRGRTASGRASYTIQTCDPSVSRTAVRWGPQFSSSAPPRSPAPSFDHFPFGPAICGDECRAERALGCGGIFPWGQQAGATGGERGGGGKGGGRRGGRREERRWN